MQSKLLNLVLLGCLAVGASGATIVSTDGSPAVFGQPGTATGWGISVTSDVFPLFTGSQFAPDPNGVGTYIDYLSSSFVFGMAGQTVTNSFDAFALTGAGEFDIGKSASIGSILFGNLQVFWDEYSVSPDNPNFDPNADFVSAGNSVMIPVSVTVGNQATPVPTPEPGTWGLALTGAALLYAHRLLASKSVRRLLVKTSMFLLFLAVLSSIAPKAFADDPPNPSSAEKQVLQIIKNQEAIAPTQKCHADGDSSVLTNCCGSPGVAACVTGFSNPSVGKSNGCTVPSSNALRLNLDGRVLCDFPKANCDARIASSLQSFNKAGPQDVTFYFTSDIHWFRSGNFLPQYQIRHVQVMNQFPNSFPWLAANPPFTTTDRVGTPAGLVIGGDFGTFGSSQELGAQRLLYEPQVDASFSFPVFVGLGNHDTSTNNTATGAKRMFEYVSNTMSCGGIHFDSASGNYSWDWGRLHLVMLNTWAGDQSSKYVHASDGLAWLQNDLATNIAQTGRPVIIFQHDGLDCFSYGATDPGVNSCDDSKSPSDQGVWLPSDTTKFLNIIRDYNIVALFNGHTHLPTVHRLDTTYYAKPISGETPVLTDSHGNPRIFDIFTNGAGGSKGDNDSTSNGDFIVARFTDGAVPDSAPYLDVQSMHWDGNGVAPTSQSPGYFGGVAGCRRRIDSRFDDLTNMTVQVSGNLPNSDSRSVTITNPTHQVLFAPLAVRVQSLAASRLGFLRHYDFVDFCGSPDSGAQFKSSSFILLTDAQIAALNSNVPVQVTLDFVNDSTQATINVAVSYVTPLSGARPSSFDVTVGPSDKPSFVFTAFGAPNTPLFLSAAYTEAKDVDGNTVPQTWLTNVTLNFVPCAFSPGCAGAFDINGRAVVNFQVDASTLVKKNVAQPHATFTIDASSGAQALAASVPVSVKLKTPVNIQVTPLTPSPYVTTTGPAVIKAQFFAADGVSIPSATDSGNVVHPTGRVFLSEATLDANGTVISATPITYVTYLNKGELCSDLFHIPNPPNGTIPGGEAVVFGDVGNQNGKEGFCPSFAYPGNNPFDSANTLTFRVHHFVVQYEGDSDFAPGMSAPFDYLVEIPLVNLSAFGGNNQSTSTGTPFPQALKAKVLQAGNATQSGIPVTFTAPSSGPTGVFAGNISTVTVLTDTSGIATAPVFSANTNGGHYTITASTQGLSTTFDATNLPPGTPLLTATIGAKSGPANARIWPVKITNSQVDAFGVAMTQMTFTQVAGAACTPVVFTPLPAAVGDLAAGASVTRNIIVDSSSCVNGARFTVQIAVTAGGNYQKTTTIGNQFP